ncbi:hypothetical protein [Roseibium album]|uniref:hypothetical protein n=1 Tax=Roseibium album TaxID=311410 RepID=UPI003298DC07
MNSHYPQDLSALADRPDFEIPSTPQAKVGLAGRIGRAFVSAGVFLGVTLGVAVVLFVPVFIFNLSRIEALEVAGETIPVSLFFDQLGALFWGTAIIALAFTSLMTGLFVMAAGATIRPRSQPVGKEDALAHLTVLRLSGSER